jgi:adenylate kinase
MTEVAGVRKYVIMGIQGSGKGTQAQLLAADLNLEHINVGDIFRWNVQHHTKLGAQVRQSMDEGHLVSDDLVEGVVHQRLSDHDWNFGFVIDGFPRNLSQAAFFLQRYDIDGVIYLDLPDEYVYQRVLSRRICSNCSLDYDLMADRPAQAGTCDVCGGTLVSRSDDTPEALAVRIATYHEQTRPVLELFERKEYVVLVDATLPVGEVQRQIRAKLSLPVPEPVD